MSSQPEPTKEQAADTRMLEEQRALTVALTNHPDPHVRLVAHMSERQLSLNELITAVRFEMREGFKALGVKIDGLAGRQDTLERNYSNGAGADSHAPDAQ